MTEHGHGRPRPPVRAVVLDIGGVLEHTPDTGWRERWARRLGVDEAQLDPMLGPVFSGGGVGEITEADAERRLGERLALSDAEVRAFMDDMWEWYVGTLNAALATWFAALRPRYVTGILSNSFPGAREREQGLYGFEDMCDVLVYSHEAGCMKPDARAYAVVCDGLGVTPAETVFLDDTPACVEGARAVGMRAVLFEDTAQAIADVQRELGEDPGSADVPPGEADD